MKKGVLNIALLLCMLVLCTTVTTAQSKKAAAWFDAQEWLMGAEMKPAVSIDIEQFAKHYAENPERWKTVFEFLSNNDLMNIPLGLQELTEHVKVNVQEYETRPTAGRKVLYEKHNKYIDVQCMVSGAELHGATKYSDDLVADIPFSVEKDIALYQMTDVPFYIIPAGTFTIFFPDQVHTTNYGFGERSNVRKLVFKVMY